MDTVETSPLNNSNHESLDKPTYLDYLQSRLREYAEQRVLSACKMVMEPTLNYRPSLIPSAADATMRDDAFSLRGIYELEISDLLNDVASVGVGQTEKISKPHVTLIVQRLSPAKFGLKFEEGDSLENTREKISEGIQSSSLASILKEATENLPDSRINTETQSFRIEDDPLTAGVILETLGLFGLHSPTIDFDSDHNPIDMVKELITNTVVKKADRSDDGKINSVNLEPQEGVRILLEPVGGSIQESEILSTSWKINVALDPKPYTMETANQSPSSKCENFINRSTGQAFISALDSSGLRFSPEFEEFIITGYSSFEDRYGGAYSQLSRVLARIIHSGDISRINDVFMSSSGEPVNEKMLNIFLSFPSGDRGLSEFQKILEQIIHKPRDMNGDDTVVTSSIISIRAGACFDVTSYYAQADKDGLLRSVELFGSHFLEKTHGAHTFINTAKFTFNGIVLPRGSLFVRGQDGGLAFLRLTPFMFDSRREMVSSFGTEVIKAETDRYDSVRIVERIKSF